MKQSRIVFLDEVDSTNAYALENFDSLADGTLVVAGTQTAGRGRRGKRWKSPEGGLYASYVVRRRRVEPVAAQRAASLAVLDLVYALAPGRPWKLKWPNDVCLFADSGLFKLAGLLTETRSAPGSNAPLGAVVGIGVNLDAMPADLAGLESPATSLRIETGTSFDPLAFAEALLERLDARMAEAEESPEKNFGAWKRAEGLTGRRVAVERGDGRKTAGTAEGVGESGELIFRADDGTVEKLLSGDVSIEYQAPEAGKKR